MTDINKVVLIGRLTRDAETKFIPSGEAVSRFSIAVNRRVKRGGEWKDEAGFFDLVLWGHEGLARHLVKGKQVAVEGSLNQSRWEQDGRTHSRVEVVASGIQLLGDGKGAGSGAPHGPSRDGSPGFEFGGGFSL